MAKNEAQDIYDAINELNQRIKKLEGIGKYEQRLKAVEKYIEGIESASKTITQAIDKIKDLFTL